MTRVQRWIITSAAAVFLVLVALGGLSLWLGHQSQVKQQQQRQEQEQQHVAQVKTMCEGRAQQVMAFDRTHPGTVTRTFDGEVAKCMATNL